MVAIGLTLLLALAVYTGLRWQLRSLTAYFTLVSGTLVIWGIAFGLRQTYAAILPVILGSLASLLLGLVGVRATRRIGPEEDSPGKLWLLGACLALAPLVMVLLSWLGKRGPGS